MVQGFLLTLALYIKNYGKPKTNSFFLALLVLICLALLMKLLYSPEAYFALPQIWYVGDLIAYLIGPLWYFTIKRSVNEKLRIQRNELVALAPMLFHIFFLMYLVSLRIDELLALEHTHWFRWSFYVFCITVLIVNGSFFLKAHQLVHQNDDVQFPDLLRHGQSIFLTILVVWLLVFLMSFWMADHYQFAASAYNFAFLSFAFLTFGLAFLALIKPSSFYFLTQTFDGRETFLLHEIAEQIQKLLKDEQPYLSSNYSLQQLSQSLQVSPVLTSRAISRVLKTNFNDLINEQRVKHFVLEAQKPMSSHLTHWAIAAQVGFGNKVSFYKSFKKHYGSTPKAYLARL